MEFNTFKFYLNLNLYKRKPMYFQAITLLQDLNFKSLHLCLLHQYDDIVLYGLYYSIQIQSFTILLLDFILIEYGNLLTLISSFLIYHDLNSISSKTSSFFLFSLICFISSILVQNFLDDGCFCSSLLLFFFHFVLNLLFPFIHLISSWIFIKFLASKSISLKQHLHLKRQNFSTTKKNTLTNVRLIAQVYIIRYIIPVFSTRRKKNEFQTMQIKNNFELISNTKKQQKMIFLICDNQR